MNRKKRILIYEDFESIRKIILKQLESRDFEVCIANTLPEALGLLNGTGFDLFITDNDMKDDVAQRIIKHMRNTTFYLFTPIILLLTGTKEQYISKLGEYNIAMYLTKPFDVTRLNTILDRMSR